MVWFCESGKQLENNELLNKYCRCQVRWSYKRNMNLCNTKFVSYGIILKLNNTYHQYISVDLTTGADVSIDSVGLTYKLWPIHNTYLDQVMETWNRKDQFLDGSRLEHFLVVQLYQLPYLLFDCLLILLRKEYHHLTLAEWFLEL